ncbi:MAG: HU family DNA-binding protein [Blastocatellia bacterium]|nr:HU family DNA-binding protein [Blastocatellia bacterium]
MNKKKLIERISQDAGIKRAAADKALNAILSGIEHSLVQSTGVVLPGFGKFAVSVRKARIGRNPKTNQLIRIPERKSIRFSASLKLKSTVNRKRRSG